MKHWITIQPVSQNTGQNIRITIGKRFHGKTLEHMLSHFKQGAMHQWMETGCFSSANSTLNAESNLASGDIIVFKKPPWIEPKVIDKLAVIHEDVNLIVIDKPEGIPVTPSGDFFQNSLVHLLRKRPGLEEVSPIHRLDLETSGVLAFAKNQEYRSFFQLQFTENLVEKEYITLVFGHFNRSITEMKDHLRKATEGPIFSKWISGTQDSRLCRTRVLEVKHLEMGGHDLTTLTLQPLSGRTNQLRAQLAVRGHSIVGDKKYFPDEQVYLNWIQQRDWLPYATRLLLPSLALHAKRLSLHLPDSQKKLTLQSERNRAREWFLELSKINGDKTRA